MANSPCTCTGVALAYTPCECSKTAQRLCNGDVHYPTGREHYQHSKDEGNDRGNQHRLGNERHHYTDRKSTRLNSSHQIISYAVFCLKKKTNKTPTPSAST